MSVLGDLQNFYANCNGDWHLYGVRINTLDNPGWSVKIDLEETNLDGKHYQTVESELSESR